MENIHQQPQHLSPAEEEHHGTGYRVNTLVWIDLLILTVITIRIAFFDLQNFTVVVALLVASVKAYLVGVFFMHLKFESKMVSIFIGLAALVYLLVMVILFSDYLFR